MFNFCPYCFPTISLCITWYFQICVQNNLRRHIPARGLRLALAWKTFRELMTVLRISSLRGEKLSTAAMFLPQVWPKLRQNVTRWLFQVDSQSRCGTTIFPHIAGLKVISVKCTSGGKKTIWGVSTPLVPPIVQGLQGTLRHPSEDSWNYEPWSRLFCPLSNKLSGKHPT